MKPAVSLCLACLLTLTACGGQTQTAPSIQPSPETAEPRVPTLSIPLTTEIVSSRPWEDELADLPTHIADSPELGFGEQPQLLAHLPGEDISLYGMGEREEVLLRRGNESALFDLPYLTPRRYFPQLFWADFDGDETQELLILTYIGSGTGISVWSPVMVEFEDGSWLAVTLPYGNYDKDLTPLLSCSPTDKGQAVIALGDGIAVSLELEDYVDPRIPADLYTGCIVDYKVNHDSQITAELAVGLHQENNIPYTLYYPAVLSAELVYDGQGFALASPALSEYSY